MELSIFKILAVIWVCIIGKIVYTRNPSHNVLILCGLLISIILILKNTQNDLNLDKEEIEWLDSMLTTKDNEEKRRCHHMLTDKLRSNYLSKKLTNDHIHLARILDHHKIQYPVPMNDMN